MFLYRNAPSISQKELDKIYKMSEQTGSGNKISALFCSSCVRANLWNIHECGKTFTARSMKSIIFVVLQLLLRLYYTHSHGQCNVKALWMEP